jgi:hypothetical protein
MDESMLAAVAAEVCAAANAAAFHVGLRALWPRVVRSVCWPTDKCRVPEQTAELRARTAANRYQVPARKHPADLQRPRQKEPAMTHEKRSNRTMAVTTLATLAAASSLLLALGACATPPMPTAQLAVAEAAVQRANTTSTQESAPAELATAVGKLARARGAVTAGDAVLALRMADEATVDAQLAEQRAAATRATLAARESENAARVLREEINRKTVR